MDKRTLVKSGTSSFTFAVPIDWVRRNNLDRGSEISVDENDAGELVLSGGRESLISQQSYCTIKVTPENSNLLYWELLRAYLRNYTTINLEGEKVSSVARPVLQHLNAFVGLEVIEQTKNVVVLKNFSARDTETSPYTLVKKLDVGVRAMIDCAQKFFTKGFSHDDVLEIQSQHEYNERMYLFALKIINNITEKPALMRIFKTDYRQLMREKELITLLRQISFHFAHIGKLLLFVEHKSKAGKVLEEMFGTIYDKYRTVITLPKSPISSETIGILFKSKEHVARWDAQMKELKVQPLLELFIHGLSINNILDQLGIELIN